MVGRTERLMKRGAKGGQRSEQGRRDELLANRMRKKGGKEASRAENKKENERKEKKGKARGRKGGRPLGGVSTRPGGESSE